MKTFKVSEFSILLYTQNGKLGNLGKFYFTSIFGSIWNPRLKNQKTSDLREIKLQLYDTLIRKNKSFQNLKFSIFACIQNKKEKILERLFYFNFETQDQETTKITRDKENYNFMMWFNKKKKKKTLRFPRFRFGPINEIENSKISENFRLL